jgi:hypothetical protein
MECLKIGVDHLQSVDKKRRHASALPSQTRAAAPALGLWRRADVRPPPLLSVVYCCLLQPEGMAKMLSLTTSEK